MGRIKNSLGRIIGKTIQSVVICRNSSSEPSAQLFLVFKDGTSFEFWVDQGQVSMASKVDEEDLEKVVSLARKRAGTVVDIVESPIARIGKDRVEREPGAADNNPLDGIAVSEIDDEHALFLAIHRRDALLCRLARPMNDAEVLEWANLLCAAFASLLQQCSFEHMDRLGGGGRWNSVVRPPSVLPCELMLFLGGLSVVNKPVYEILRRRASVEAFLKLSNRGAYFKDGEDHGREILVLMQA